MKASASFLFTVLALGQGERTFEVNGICAIDEARVSCWNPSGAPLAGLATTIERQLRVSSLPLSLVSGRKNRFLVVQERVHAWERIQGRGKVQSYVLAPEEGWQPILYRIAAEPRDSAATLTFEIGVYEGASVDILFRNGAKATVGGVRVEIGSIEEKPNDTNYFGVAPASMGMWSRPWRVAIDQTETGHESRVVFEAVGRNGEPIHFLDAEGKPMSDARIAASIHDFSKPLDRSPILIFVPAVFGDRYSGFKRDASALSPWTYTNVDPRWIAKLRLRRVVSHTEKLGPFPLDPQPSVP